MNAYDKLRPWTAIERCECASLESLVLVDLLTDNPIHCGACRREIDPERLQLTTEETEAIARWLSAASALYRLWLDSGEYENYAKARLSDPNGQVNVDGLTIARALSSKWPTRIWFFHDTEDGEPTHCPVCGRPLDKGVTWGIGCCDRCCLRI
jgi:muconolactone delta-isomerase